MNIVSVYVHKLPTTYAMPEIIDSFERFHFRDLASSLKVKRAIFARMVVSCNPTNPVVLYRFLAPTKKNPVLYKFQTRTVNIFTYHLCILTIMVMIQSLSAF